MHTSIRRLFAGAALLAALSPLPSAAYSSFVVFGDSLSDSGNNAIVLGTRPNQVITGNDYVPTFPYAPGTYSNGAVWATTFASAIGLQALPSLRGGTDYAYGGAETGGRTKLPPSLLKQVDAYLSSSPMQVADTLFVIAGGANDGRHAIGDIQDGAPQNRTINSTARNYARNVGQMVDALQAAGAQHIVVWDTPDLGKTPEAGAEGTVALSTAIATKMNEQLERRLRGEAGVSIFDVYGLLDSVVAHPAQFGFTNVTDACGALSTCDPSSYLFWDAIHPTSGGHAILADEMFARYGGIGAGVAAVPEPATALLFAAGALLLVRQASARTRRSTSPASL